jgi:crotonobetainyl-CoA:carnitine CoA-transferase CaiB-like acyl-CoA transferase
MTMTSGIGMEGALAGLRVLDLTQFEAGPSCTEAMAFHGAEVVKLENPTLGDQGRFRKSGSDEDSYYFLELNANKKSVTCNLKSEKGLAMAKDMVKQADVFIENFAPGAIERLGLGYDVVRELNPKIIYAQVKGYAQDGPHANYLSFDMIGQSVGGLLSITGERDGVPIKPGPTIGDTGTGMLMCISILSAYVQRMRTGKGQRIQLALPMRPWRTPASRVRAPATRPLWAAPHRRAFSPARAAGRMITSTSLPAAPTSSTGTASAT